MIVELVGGPWDGEVLEIPDGHGRVELFTAHHVGPAMTPQALEMHRGEYVASDRFPNTLEWRGYQ